ncbi:hypothetical protein OIV83_005587 [Microbotryomycetes sp. JL201]|nr:hypothetical protein OIV83_005587 [Microbotryomycetes sp. JL201]
MLSLSEAVRTELQFERGSGAFVYKATHGVSEAFCIGTNPHGGYMLSLAASALVKHQRGHLPFRESDDAARSRQARVSHTRSGPFHPDMAHIRSDFYKPASPGPCQIELTPTSTSKNWSRLDFRLTQYATVGDNQTDVVEILSGHAMFTNLPAVPGPELPVKERVTVLPHTPLPQARKCPLTVHPSKLKKSKVYSGAQFKNIVHWTGKGEAGVEAKDALEWACWWGMDQDEDDVTNSAVLLPFFADQFMNGPELLPDEYSPGRAWYPTLTFSLDVKSKYPLTPIPKLANSAPAKHTVGLYSLTKAVHEGRHDITVEVWSAPSEIDDQDCTVDDDWRHKAQLLGVSTQMALVISREKKTARPGSASSSDSERPASVTPPGKL